MGGGVCVDAVVAREDWGGPWWPRSPQPGPCFAAAACLDFLPTACHPARHCGSSLPLKAFSGFVLLYAT